MDRSRRAFDAVLVSGALLAAADLLVALRRDHSAWRLTPFILSLVLAASLPLAPFTLAMATLTGFRPEIRPAVRKLIAGATAVALAIPALGIVVRLASAPGIPLALATIVLLVVVVGSFVFGARAGLVGFVLSIGGAWVALELQDSMEIVIRLNPRSMDLITFVALASGFVAPGLALELFVLNLGVDGVRFRRRTVAVLGALGCLSGLASFSVPENYPTTRLVGLCSTVLLFAAAFTRLRLPSSFVARGAVTASILAGPLYLARVTTPLDRTSWSLARDSPIAAPLAARAGLFRGGFQKLRTALLLRPEAKLGSQLPSTAVAWNRAAAAQAPTPPKRSAILVSIDTLRFDHLGYSGAAPEDISPSIDRLASRSMRFRHCYSQASHTALSVPSLFFSQYPHSLRFGTYLGYWFSTKVFPDEPTDVGAEEAGPLALRTSILPIPFPTLSEIVARSGRRTIAAVNDGGLALFIPQAGYTRGFGEVIHTRTVLSQQAGHPVADADDASTVAFALDALSRRTDEPFFLWIHLFGPHYPYNAPRRLRGKFDGYDAEVHASDAAVGQLLDGLERLGHRDDTAIVLVSDHGEEFRRNSGVHGALLFESSVRIPCLVAIPGAPGGDFDSPVGLIDVAPTMLQALGIGVPPTMMGYSLFRALDEGASAQRPPVLAETWQFEGKGPQLSSHQLSLVQGTTKLLFDADAQGFGLYDLAADPTEKRNLMGSVDVSETFAAKAAFLMGWDSTATENGLDVGQPDRHDSK